MQIEVNPVAFRAWLQEHAEHTWLVGPVTRSSHQLQSG